MIDMYPTKIEMKPEWVAVDKYLRYHMMPSRLVDCYIGFIDEHTCDMYTVIDSRRHSVWRMAFKYEEDGTPKLLKAIPLVEEQK